MTSLPKSERRKLKARERSEAAQGRSGSRVWGGGGGGGVSGSLLKPEQDGYVTRAYLWRRHRGSETLLL